MRPLILATALAVLLAGGAARGEGAPAPGAAAGGDNGAVLSPAAPPSADAGKEAPPPPPAAAKKGSTAVYLSLDFTDVDLPVLVKFISEQTKRNFIFDERVTGKITIISPKRVSLDEAYDIFLSVLQVKGFTTVEQGNAIKIVPIREARGENLPTDGTAVEGAPASEVVTRLVPLQYADPAELVPLLTPLVSKDGLISAFPSSGSLLLIDTRLNIDRVLRIIAELDVEGTTPSVRIIPLKNAAAADMARVVEQLFQETGAAVPGAPPGAAGRARGRSARARGASLKVIPDGRTNSLIVLSGKDLLDEIEELVRRVDVPSQENTGKISVYYLENANAEELAKVLASLTEKRGGAAAPAAAPPGAAPATIKGAITVELEGGVRITADKATNSLIIVASPGDYQTLLDVIRKLDIRRRQVYVEALIMEISQDKSKDVGVEYRGVVDTGNGAVLSGTNFDFTGNVNSLFTALATGNPLVFGGTGLIAGGIGGSVKLPDGSEVPAITAVLRAAQEHQNVNVLSTPHLLTLDNKEAEIVVGENVPFITSQSRDTTNLSNVINNVERKDVGVTLKITPHIQESDYVTLDLAVESSSVKATSAIDVSQVGPTTTKRSAKTSVIVRSGDMVVLGGMMQETTGTLRRQVPLLGDIPYLGWFFRFNSVSRKKTNMLVLLTPKVVKAPEDLVETARQQRARMEELLDRASAEVEKRLPEKSSRPPAGGK